MAGRRQHHMPQFLAKGFASRSKGDAIFTFLFLCDGEPHETNIVNVGVSKDFYGRPDDGLDGTITAIEGTLATTVAQVRQGQTRDVDPADLADLVGHLAVRSRHLREVFLDAFRHLSHSMRNVLSDSTISTGLVLKCLNKDPARFLDPALKRAGYPSFWSLPTNARDSALTQAEEYLREGVRESLDDYVEKYFARVDREIVTPSELKKHHNSVLGQHIGKLRSVRFDGLNWQTSRTNEPLILGDCGPVVFKPGPDHFRWAFEFEKETDLLLLPVSRDDLLVGSAVGFDSVPTTEMINRASSVWSVGSFVASRNTPYESRLHAAIGNEVRPWLQSLIESTIPNLIETDFGI